MHFRKTLRNQYDVRLHVYKELCFEVKISRTASGHHPKEANRSTAQRRQSILRFRVISFLQSRPRSIIIGTSTSSSCRRRHCTGLRQKYADRVPIRSRTEIRNNFRTCELRCYMIRLFNQIEHSKSDEYQLSLPHRSVLRYYTIQYCVFNVQ